MLENEIDRILTEGLLWYDGLNPIGDREEVTEQLLKAIKETVERAEPEERGEVIDIAGGAGVVYEQFCGRCGDLDKCTCKSFNEGVAEFKEALLNELKDKENTEDDTLRNALISAGEPVEERKETL